MIVAIFDCNVLLQAMLSTRGPAHACWRCVVDRKVKLLVAPFMLAEVRRLPSHRDLQRFQQLTAERVQVFIEEVLLVAESIGDPPKRFTYARDPDDARYVDAMLATGASCLVSNDRDLLDLMRDTSPEGVTLRAAAPAFQVLTPPQFLQAIEDGGRINQADSIPKRNTG